MNELTVVNFGESLDGLEKTKAEQIESAYKPMVEALKAIEGVTSDIVDEFEGGGDPSAELVARAKRQRLDVAKVRTGADRARKEIKNEYLLASRAIDGAYNQIKWVVNGHEEKMTEIEKYYETLEIARKAELQATREAEAEKYLDSANGIDFAAMADDVWATFIAGAKETHRKKIEAEEVARRQAERKALDATRRVSCASVAMFIDGYDTRDFADMSEEDYTAVVDEAKAALVEHQERQKAIAKENDRLRKEAEKAEQAAKEKARAAKEEADRKIKEARAAEAKAREEADRLAREKMEEERSKAAQLVAKAEASDKEKLLELSSTMNEVMASLKSTKAREAVVAATGLITSIIAKI